MGRVINTITVPIPAEVEAQLLHVMAVSSRSDMVRTCMVMAVRTRVLAVRRLGQLGQV